MVEKTAEQQAGIRSTLIWTLGFIALMLGLLLYSVTAPRGLSPQALQDLGYYGFPNARTITDINLVDHEGNPFTAEDLAGQWSLVFFGFTYCPDICPTTLGVLNRAVSGLEQPPRVIMVSVDPERDTPEALARYVPSFNQDFIGVTGEFDDIVTLATQLNAAFGKVPGKEPGTYTVDHTASIVVINPRGQYAGFIKAPHQETSIRQVYEALTL